MIRISICCVALVSAFGFNAYAQNQLPVVASPIENFTVYAGAPARSIDLRAVIQDKDQSPVVRMN